MLPLSYEHIHSTSILRSSLELTTSRDGENLVSCIFSRIHLERKDFTRMCSSVVIHFNET